MPKCDYSNPKPRNPTEQGMLSDLSHILDNASRCATFTCGGSLPVLTDPSRDGAGNLTPRTDSKVQDQRVLTKSVTLRWGPDGQGRTISFPLQSERDHVTFEQLLQDCTPATFGRGGEDVYDETYRRALALSAEEFMTSFCPYKAGIIDIITQLLLPPITGDLTPPPRRPDPEDYELNDVQLEKVSKTIDKFALETDEGLGIKVKRVQECLEMLEVGPANAQEMLEIQGELDPEGTGLVFSGYLRALVEERVRKRWARMRFGGLDPKVMSHRMMKRGLRAELYKLNVYAGPSGMFKKHVDTPRSETQIGSLVVCLPVHFEGGALAVRHQLEEVVYDWATPTIDQDNEGEQAGKGEDPKVQWAAFYSDCQHEVLEVTAGHRATLTYNLFLAPGTSLLAGRPTSLDTEQLPLVTNLKTMLANDKFMSKGGYLGIHLSHQYPHTHAKLHHLVPSMLKGVDMAICESVSTLGLPAMLCPATKSNLAPHKALEPLEQLVKKAFGSSQLPRIANQPRAFEADGELDEFRGMPDEDDMRGEVEEAFAYDTEEDEWSEDEYTQRFPDASEQLWEWKGRFDDRAKICWVNEAKQEELSSVFMAYGNQAELAVTYSSAALVVKIPKNMARKEAFPILVE